MSDSDNDVGRAGESVAHDSAEPASPGNAAAPARRPLAAWSSATVEEPGSIVTRMRKGISSLWKSPDGETSTVASAPAFGAQTLEFQPEPEITLFRPTPQNLDIARRLGALEEKTDEFEITTEPILEAPTQPIRWPRLAAWLNRRPKLHAVLQRLGLFRQPAPPTAETAAATVVEASPVFLYAKFRTFYNEIIRFKHRKTEFTAGFATALMSDAASLPSDAAGAAEALSKKLAEVLELQAAEAKWMGGEMGSRYPDAQYAMAALADETFTHMEWEGRAAWPDHLLEQRLFKTRAASHDVFKRMDRLLKDAPNTPASRDLARVYLMVIAAGFQGKYRPFGLTRALAEYRQRLYEYIYRGDPLLLYSPERTLIPEIASRTVQGNPVSRISNAQRWAAILAFVAVSYALTAHVAWNRVSADLKDVTARIVVDSAAGDR